MRKTILVSSFLFLALACASHASAQDQSKPADAARAQEPPHYFHLELVVEELGSDGKPTNSRTYTTTVSTESRGSASIRTNSKIPVPTGSSPAQYQYVDAGVRIDAQHASVIGHQLSVNLTADVNSVSESHDPNLHQPIVRNNSWQALVLIPLGKPTVVFTSDVLDSKGSMQLVVTATAMQ